jgi:predicted Zn-ribbon and HTH transcriptional regulator
MVKSASIPTLSLQDIGADIGTVVSNSQNAQRYNSAFGNAERPSNIVFRKDDQSLYWRMYDVMDWYRREVSVFSTIITRSVSELFRYDLELKPKFAMKCQTCGYESQTIIKVCPACKGHRLRKPDPSQKDYFKRANGKSFIEEANDNGQSLKDVLKMYAESQWQNNQAYTVCITGDVYSKDTGRLEKAIPLEFIPYDPKFVRYLYDDTGKPGKTYAFVRSDRHSLINMITDEEKVNDINEQGLELYPATWQIGENFGGTGRYWLYTKEEVYQDNWFRQSMTYGVPIWYDIEDDLLTYHFIEKHNLKKYKYGYVRKMIILPGFNEDDVEDIIKGIQDILATNDNSIPIICTPPQIQGVAEMRAQTLELGTESSADLMQIKNDIRDRLCAHGGVPNIFAGDVEASGGMNNESQQITIYDRYLMGPYSYVDRQCKWIMSWFPKITDYELSLMRPSKAYTDTKRMIDRIQEAQLMKSLGYDLYFIEGEFRYSEEPVDQIQRKQQEAMQQQMMAMGGMGMMPGDGEGPPEEGTARREDSDIDASKDEIDLAKREADESPEV